MNDCLYVSLKGDDTVARFTISSGGALGGRVDFPLPGGPGPMVMHPSRSHLFVGLRAGAQLAALRVEEDGRLTPACRVQLPSDPCFLCTDVTGTHILSTYYRAGQVAVHRWHAGARELAELQRLDTAPNAHSIRLEPGGRHAWAMHTGPNRIYRFAFNAPDGTLAPLRPPWLEPEPGFEPRHACLHPTLPRLYVLGECSGMLAVYRLEDAGGLVLEQAVSTLPAGAGQGNLSAEVRITPDGRFVYASNRAPGGNDSIAAFAVASATGLLAPAGHTAAPAGPRSFDLSPNGRYLYAAGETSGELACYAVDTETGRLTETGRFYIGKAPMWVMGVTA